MSIGFELSELSNKHVFITGATGLIGMNIVKRLLDYNYEYGCNINITIMVRNRKKANIVFGKYISDIRVLQGDVNEPIVYDGQVDLIIHAASCTSSKAFVETPVDAITTIFHGTENVLAFAAGKGVQSFVYLSTMEVYGTPQTDDKIYETSVTNIDPMKVRSCYPESKRLSENLCRAFMEQYGIPIKVLRLTQTFGPGVNYDDGRVFAEFARCVIEKKDILLHTMGDTRRNYLYTEDAVDAILTVLLRGQNGEAYNAANEDTYCSIREMAEMVALECAHNEIDVRIELEENDKRGYAPTLHMNLSTEKLRSLGWEAQVPLQEMYLNMIADMKAKY